MFKLSQSVSTARKKHKKAVGVFLSVFLRHLRVDQDNAISNKIELKACTPKGSALSPLLFLLYVNDTPKPPPGVFTSKICR